MIIRVPNSKKIQKLLKTPINVNEGFFDSPEQKQQVSGASVSARQGATYLKKHAEEQEIPKIERFLNLFDILNYKIECTGNGIFVDVQDHLFLPNKKLTGFPGFKFRYVEGNCNLSGNRFTDFSQFPRRIGGSCLANFNYIKSFQGAPDYIGGNLIANKQKVKPVYPLTKENYDRYMHDEDLLENRVYVISENDYGELQSINEDNNTCVVLMNDGHLITTPTNNADCMGMRIKFLL